jgi:hypothetical protein
VFGAWRRADFSATGSLLRATGVERIFSEKVSGIAARRPELEYVLDRLEGRDVLVVIKLDRLLRGKWDVTRLPRDRIRALPRGRHPARTSTYATSLGCLPYSEQRSLLDASLGRRPCASDISKRH